MIRAYASRTGTKVNLDALRAAGWRLMLSATGVWRTEGFPYALDNGAWTAFQSGAPFDVARFTGLLERFGEGADFVVVPDVVRGGHESLRLSLRWLDRLWWVKCPRLVAVQDGVTPADLDWLLGSDVGIFVGGTDDWKEKTMGIWAAAARARGAICHVGRVNTQRRLRKCLAAEVDSFDGSSVSRFACHLPLLERVRLTHEDQIPLPLQ